MPTYTPTEMIALAILFSIIPVIAVALRLWARRIMKARWEMDDWFVFVALGMCVAAGGAVVYGAIHGEIGRHQDLGPNGEPILSERMRVHGKIKYTSQLLELLSFGTAKLSVLYLYRRIFAYPSFTRIANLFILVVVGWTISFFFVILLQCVPVSSLWDMLDGERMGGVGGMNGMGNGGVTGMGKGGNGVHCVNMTAFFYANSVSDVLLDMAILAMPVPLVWGLRLGWRRKLAVGGMFALGGVVVLSSLIRLIIFIQFVPSLPQHRSDTTYYESPFSYWSHIEASLGVISACLPVLRPIFVRPAPHSSHPSNKDFYSGPNPVPNPNTDAGGTGPRKATDRSNFRDDIDTEKGNPFDDEHAISAGGSKPASLGGKDSEIQAADFSLEHRFPEAMESDHSLAESRSGAPIVRKPAPLLSREGSLQKELPRLPKSGEGQGEGEGRGFEGRERAGEMV